MSKNHTHLHLPDSPGIYQIVNNVTQKSYIGYASSIRSRIKGHISDLMYGKHPNDYLQKAWNKHGRYNFCFKVLQECQKDQLCLYEDYWAKVLKVNDPEFGYNLKPTDPNGKPGQSLETIEKIRRANKGRKPSDLCMQRRKEVKTSDEGKKRILESRKDIDYTRLHREKRGKQVFDWENGIIYRSLGDVEDTTGIPRYELSRKLSGKRRNNTNYSYL